MMVDEIIAHIDKHQPAIDEAHRLYKELGLKEDGTGMRSGFTDTDFEARYLALNLALALNAVRARLREEHD